MQTVGHTVKTGLRFVQWHCTRNPVKERDPIGRIDNGRIELPNISLQAIEFDPSCSRGKPISNLLKIGKGISHV